MQQNHNGRGRWVVSLLILAVVCLAIGATAGVVYVRSQRSDMRELIAIKSQAESLAIDGKLNEAHATYRQLSNRIAAHKIKDPFFWDVFDRARVDQDRIYTMILDEQWTKKTTVADSIEEVTDIPGGGVGRKPRTVEQPAPEKPKKATVEEAEQDKPQPEPAEAEPAPAVPNKPDAPVPPRWVPENEITDDDIGYAIKRGVEHLLSHVHKGEIDPIPGMTGVRFAGRDALIVYALLTAGQATGDPRLDPRHEFMDQMIEKLKSYPLETPAEVRNGVDDKEPSAPVTYARSIRAAALALYNRKQDRDCLKKDAEWLIHAHVGGAYTYDDRYANRQGSLLKWDALDQLLNEADCHGLHDPVTNAELPVTGTYVGRPNSGHVGQPNSGRVGEPKSQRLPPMTQKPLFPAGKPPPRQEIPAGGGNPGPIVRGTRNLPRPDVRTSEPPLQFPWDNSNSQYGLLGVWAASEVGVEVPRAYWEAVQNHWESCQFKSGEWGYQPQDRDARFAMTCGGIASLWVTYDELVAPKHRGQVGRQPMSDRLTKGMTWLETEDNSVRTPTAATFYPGYDLYVLERVGLASGFKYFGAHNWYKELTARCLSAQLDNGAWGWPDGRPDGLIETAYQVLFLSHGRHPIFINKLRFDKGQGTTVGGKPLTGYWTNRPRDIANLARYASRELERPFNWQVVDLEREWHDWLDCPVLYIASHEPPSFRDSDYEKLRQYAEAGGLIFTHADAGAPNFNRWVLEELIPKVFPGRKAEIVPETDPIYSLNYDIKRPRPQLYAVSNGARMMLVHSPTDLATIWQQRGETTQSGAFKIGVHLFLYAAGKTDFRNRIDSPYVPPAPKGEHGSIAVARVKYDGEWDPEPGAWRRFANLYAWENDANVSVTPLALADLDVEKTPVAHMTGTTAVAFTDADAKALRKFVQAGGMFLVDPCGGSKAFDHSVTKLLDKAFPDQAPRKVPKTDVLMTGGQKGLPPLELRLRRYDLDKLKMTTPPLEMITLANGVVVISHVDITTGLLGTNTLTVVGYEPAYAQAITWNLLGWTRSQLEAAGKAGAEQRN
jgi:hypothetical protein